MTDIEADILKSMTNDCSTFPTSVAASNRVLRILRTLQSDDGSDIIRLVSSEPLLTAKVLRLANSVAFNTGHPVRTLAPAVMKIGTNNVQTLALILVVDQLRKKHKLPECQELSDRMWSHSVYLAALCYVMSNVKRNKLADEALLLGIVYNIGKFYTLAHISEPTQILDIVNACHIKARELIFAKLQMPKYLTEACHGADFGASNSPLSSILIDALSLASSKDPCAVDPLIHEVDFSVDEHAAEIYSVVLSLES